MFQFFIGILYIVYVTLTVTTGKKKFLLLQNLREKNIKVYYIKISLFLLNTISS